MFFFNLNDMSENTRKIVTAIFLVLFAAGAIMFLFFAISTVVSMIRGTAGLVGTPGIGDAGVDTAIENYPAQSRGCCFLPCCLPLPLFAFGTGTPFLGRFFGKSDDEDK